MKAGAPKKDYCKRGHRRTEESVHPNTGNCKHCQAASTVRGNWRKHYGYEMPDIEQAELANAYAEGKAAAVKKRNELRARHSLFV